MVAVVRPNDRFEAPVAQFFRLPGEDFRFPGGGVVVTLRQMSEPSLIILMPAYNEAQRIRPVLAEYAAYFRRQYTGPFRIVVVVNGCVDNTLEVVREAGAEHPEIRAIEFKEAIGKGGALIEGLKLASETELIGFVDADGATGPESFIRLVRECREVDCTVGSRRLSDSVIHQSQPTRRLLASRVYHMIVEALFHMRINDTQCGAKVMRREAVERIHKSLHIADMAFDVNLLFALKRAGFRLREVPVEWTDKIGTKVTYFRTSFVMFLSVLRLRMVYSPFYRWLQPLRPLEGWIYRKLRNPPPLPPVRADRAAKQELPQP